MNRRSLILGTVALAPGVAGCSTSFAESPMLDVTVFNQTDTPYTIELSLLRDADETRSEARAFSSRVDVEPDGKTTRESVAAADEPYVVRYGVYENDSRLTDQDHVHYYPGDGDADDNLAFDIRSPGELTRR